jgi:transcriptional regulator with XRE-family HTH domain
MRELGQHLVVWRKLRGLTAAQVADRADISRGTLSKLERGEGANLEVVLRVARALGIMDPLIKAADPYETDIGRLRAGETLPQRVRHPRTEAE